jgi:hypothetical protein
MYDKNFYVGLLESRSDVLYTGYPVERSAREVLQMSCDPLVVDRAK